jgi:hypothetical protein
VVIIRIRWKDGIQGSVNWGGVTVTECRQKPRLVIGHNLASIEDGFMVDAELRFGAGYAVVCVNYEEGHVIARVNEADIIWIGRWTLGIEGDWRCFMKEVRETRFQS